jgi:catechol 2,3-dioxygenase-like lactoylglutathione lyase family enzyme
MTKSRSTERAASNTATPHAFESTGLSVSLTVDDLGASLTWYRDVLGFAVERDFERGGVPFAVRMRAGSVALLLTQDNGARGSQRVKGEGLSIRFTTAQNIDDLAARAKASGAVLDSEPADISGMRAFRLRDPDGFRLVISSEP